MHNLDKAREWANRGEPIGGVIHPDAKAAIEIIQSLPDQWIDAEKVREEAGRMRKGAVNAMKPGHNEFSRGYAEAMRECARHLRNILTPSLPTLADMTAEEREACQWMQCKIDGQFAGILARVDAQRGHIWVDSGYSLGWKLENITPLPDLPKLQWPGGVVDCEIVEESLDDQAVAKDVCNSESNSSETPKSSIKPEDVPANEPWLIEVDGQKAIGTRHKGSTIVPWSVAALDGSFAGDYHDSEVTLIHKLVPESPALPEGMRLADHEEYGRVVTSPWGDGVDDYKIFFLNEDVRAGADYEYANESTLTFLGGEE